MFSFLCSNSNVNYYLGTTVSIVVGIITVAVLFLGFYFLIKAKNTKMELSNKYVICVLIIAFVLRIIFGLCVTGHRREFFEIYYKAIDGSLFDISPLTYAVVKLFSLLVDGLSKDNLFYNLVIKLPFILADVGTVYLLYRIGKRNEGEYFGIVISSIFAICPLFIFTSSVWGSSICLVIPILILSLDSLVERKYALSILYSSISLLLCKEVLYIIPVYCVYFGIVWGKALVNHSKYKTVSRDLYMIPAVILICVALKYLLSLPYMFAIENFSYFDHFHRIFIAPIADNVYYGVNSLNVFSIYGLNAVEIDGAFPQVLFAILFAVAFVVITLIVYKYRKNRALVVFVLTFCLITVYTYCVGFTATSLVPAVALLLLDYVYTQDKRVLRTFAVTVILEIVLFTIIFTIAGYYNTIEMSNFTSPSYTGMTWLIGQNKAIIIVLSVLQVLNHLYMAVYLFDLTTNESMLKLNEVKYPNFKNTVKQIFTNK